MNRKAQIKTSLNIKKEQLRQKYKQVRKKFRQACDTTTYAETVFNNLKHIIKDSQTIAGYYPKDDEFDIRPILERLNNVCLPYLVPNHKQLQFKAWRSNDPLEPGPFNVLQPVATAPDVIPDILLMPLIAVDQHGNRLGYGKGHYDFTIQHLKPILLIGICYDIQVIDFVPNEDHDAVLDYIVTEKNLYKCKP